MLKSRLLKASAIVAALALAALSGCVSSHVIVGKVRPPISPDQVQGISKNVKLTYVTTLIEGHDQIVVINAWTGATHALQQMPMLESLADMLSGIS
jgi:uncharacterized protein (DUF2342 family)